ncbi:MAG: hypothetical protein CME65_05385 [Halobacteriovoraceae bacterium]|nr:hypothetical protein [Halobacteriovoraceae bacterium]
MVINYDKKVSVRNRQNKIFKADMNFFVSTKADRSLERLTCVGSNSEARKLSLADACSSAGGFSTMNMCVFAQYLAGGYTLTIPAEAAGVASVTVIGGGGGMGMKDHSHWNGYGGGGGGAANKRMLLEAGATYKIEVGPGRVTSTSGWSNSRNLGPGGTSQFIDNDTGTVIMSATGGRSGRETSSVSNVVAMGGVGSGGDVNCTGGTGRNGKYFEGQGESGQCLGGSGGAGGTGGGASIYGGEGGSGKCGAGGGRFHGQNGADGCIIIEW